MGDTTEIAWTDHTFNPWWGCAKVSPACNNCYAENLAIRTGHDVWGKNADRRKLSERHWRRPLVWAKQAHAAGRPSLVFCASMADVFEDRPDVADERDDLFELIQETGDHLIWQLLTKRPENISRMVPGDWIDGIEEWSGFWPEHVWIGTTVEDQRRANERIPQLLEVDSEREDPAVRFLSCEPLLEELDLTPWLDSVDWVICGGESGPGHRPLDLDHARSLRDQCEAFGVPFFFKQVGGHTAKAGGDLLDSVEWKQFPKAAGR